jgi:hypothetical protein
MVRRFWQWWRTPPPANIGFWQYVLEYGFLRFALMVKLIMDGIVRPVIYNTSPFFNPIETIAGFLFACLFWASLMWLIEIRPGGVRGNR